VRTQCSWARAHARFIWGQEVAAEVEVEPPSTRDRIGNVEPLAAVNGRGDTRGLWRFQSSETLTAAPYPEIARDTMLGELVEAICAGDAHADSQRRRASTSPQGLDEGQDNMAVED
jgi:hypothetical protein